MSGHTNYKPGHAVHFIQARLALQEMTEWQPGIVTEISEGTIRFQASDGVVSTFNCQDTTRLREIYESGRVPNGRDGKAVAILTSRGVLIIPCADAGKTFPLQAEVIATVAYIEDGAAQYSPTTDGAWHLFSVEATE